MTTATDAATLARQLIDLGAEARSEALQAERAHLNLGVVEALKAEADRAVFQDPHHAARLGELAAQVADLIDEPLAHALAWWITSNAQLFLGDYRACLTGYGQARLIYEAHDRRVEVARLRINEVVALRHLGRYAEALTAIAEARRLLTDDGPSRFTATLEMNAGIVQYQLGEYAAALAAYEVSAAWFEANGDDVQAARLAVNRAITLEKLDRVEEADRLWRGARAVLLADELNQEVARVDLNIGIGQYRQGNYRAALQVLEQARQGFAAIEQVLELAVVDLYRAYVYLALNLWPEAAALAQACEREFAARQMPRQVALALSAQGRAWREQGQWALALRLLRRARRHFKQQGAVAEAALIDLELADVQVQTGNLPGAQRLAARAIRALTAHGLMGAVARGCLIQAQCALSTDRWVAAGRWLEQASTASAHWPGRELAYQVQHMRGRWLEARHDSTGALAAYQAALDMIDHWRTELLEDELGLAFVADKWVVFEDAVRVAVDLNRLDIAVEMVRRAEALTVPSLSAAVEAHEAATALRERLQTLRRHWHWRQSQLEARDDLEDEANPERTAQSQAAAWADLRQLEATISDVHWRYAAHLADHGAAPHADDAHSTNSVQIQYVVLRGQVGALVTYADRLTWHPALVAAEDVSRWVKEWRFSLDTVKLYPPDFVQEHAAALRADAQRHVQRLYDWLIAPLNLPQIEPLDDAPGLALSLPGALAGVPFAVMFDGATYLLERWQIRYVVSGRWRADPPANLARVLVLACSDAGRLPFAAPEAEQVAALTGAASDMIFIETGLEAADLLARSRSASVIHLATHAIYRRDNPLFSWVQLPGTRLTVSEWHAERFAAQPLITLSACETGLGGPLGFGRALIAAGAGAVVASLWKVEDASTAELMTDFYRALGPGRPIGTALRAAQLAALARKDHPLYWGGFALFV